MNIRKNVFRLILFFLMTAALSSCKSKKNESQFQNIDLQVKKIKIQNYSVKEIADSLMYDFALTDIEKARCIYDWICLNIEHDENTKIDDAERVLSFKRGSSKGISNLFYMLASSYGLDSRQIEGYLKKEPYLPMQELPEDTYFWNTVLIDGKEVFIDAALGCRMTEEEIYDYWFNVNPYFFIFSHYPLEDYLQGLEKAVTLDTFVSLPYLSPVLEKAGLKGKEVFSHYITSEDSWNPQFFDNFEKAIDDGLRIEQIPLEYSLSSGKEYTFCFSGNHPNTVILREGSFYKEFELNRPFSYRPSTNGAVLIGIKQNKVGKTFNTLLRYKSVQEPAILERICEVNEVSRKEKAVPEMVFVKGGTFEMGSENYETDEYPVHSVTVKDFYVGKYEVTQKEWESVMGENPCSIMGYDYPVSNVSWYDAVEFCNRLSRKDGFKEVYSIDRKKQDNENHALEDKLKYSVSVDMNADGYRLLTEEEWEYCAHGNDFSYTMFSGEKTDIEKVCWFNSNSLGKPHCVGTKKANALNLFDMSGNLLEMCFDWKIPYKSDDFAASTKENDGDTEKNYNSSIVFGGSSERVARGGSFSDNVTQCVILRRYGINPSLKYKNIGFRLARNKKE